jgi:polyphosphate kinase
MTDRETATSVQEPIGAIEPVPAPAAPDDLDLHDKSLYFGRELSWLDFNERVLELVDDHEQPLLERVKLAAIWASNLDEFFQIRVAGVHDQIDAGLTERGPDGLTPSQTIDAIRERVLSQQQRLEECVLGKLFPALAEQGIRIVGMADIGESDRAALGERFRRQIFPVLTPLAVGHGRPFPYISSLSLSLGVLVRDPTGVEDTFARVKVPTEMLPRFVALDDDPNRFVTLEEVIAANLDALFPGMEILSHGFFRVTRDADFEVSDEADDLLQAVEAELRRRRFGEAVRLEIDTGTDASVRELLRVALDLEERQVYEVDGILDTSDLWQIYNLPGFGELRDPVWTPVTQPRLQGTESEHDNVMAQMRKGDILVHHPYDSFATSVERFVE